jgi:myo-inositol-1(or 4)-monophosphatase
MKDFPVDCLRQAGSLLLQHFGRVQGVRIKDSRSSIVTDADLASDHFIRAQLRARFPDDNILTEESGFENRDSTRTWIVDPLDGTSNFAEGIPWFGIMLALLEHGEPVAGAMLLPVEDQLYLGFRHQGTTRNGQPVRVTPATSLGSVLCAYGLDASTQAREIARQTALLARIVQQVRNVRATNSLVDFALTIDGRLGACVNFHTKVWDIAAPALLLQEAGGSLTDLTGDALEFSLGPDASDRSYAVAGGNPTLHRALVSTLQTPDPWDATPGS